MTFSLEGLNALVLGGTKGIGHGIAKAYVAAGARVVITGRKAADATRVAASLGPQASGIGLDTAKIDEIDRAFAELQGLLGGKVDIFILNSGGPPPGPARGVSSALWQEWWTTMFVSPVRLADILLPGMIERRFGRIISVVSSSVIQPIPNLGMSNAIRPAVIGWGKSVSNEVGPFGVTVNAIAPGRIATERLETLDGANAARSGKSVEQVRTEAFQRIPVGRYGTAEEFAAAALFLASREASFTTGSILRVDGGQISSM
jgi:3-oxoacyl-[acyl-carrier protein] reductase